MPRLPCIGTVNAFGFSGVLLVAMAIQKDRLDERIEESDMAQGKSDQTRLFLGCDGDGGGDGFL